MMTSGNVTNQMLNIAQAQIGGETLNAAQKMNENSAKAAKKEIEQKARKQFREEKGKYSLEELEVLSETQCKHRELGTSIRCPHTFPQTLSQKIMAKHCSDVLQLRGFQLRCQGCQVLMAMAREAARAPPTAEEATQAAELRELNAAGELPERPETPLLPEESE